VLNIPNGAIRSKSDPVRNRLVLLEFHRKGALCAKTLLGRLKVLEVMV